MLRPPRPDFRPHSLAEILDLADCAALVLRAEGAVGAEEFRLVSANGPAARTFDFDVGASTGRPIEEVAPRLAIDATPIWREVLVTGKAQTLTRDILGKAFDVRVLRMAPQTIAVILQDATWRTEVMRLKNEFVSTVSHELRTPLTSIRGALGLLEAQALGPISGESLEIVRIARTESDRLVRIINDLLDLDRIEAGKLRVTMRPTEIIATLKACLRALEVVASEAQVKVKLESPSQLIALADKDRLAQVVTNLVGNAVKFSPPGAEVLVKARRVEKTIRIEVRDKGPGISRADLDLLFTKFHQADQSDGRTKPGTGLGLAISKSLVELMEGRIGVESKVGQGSIFWVDLQGQGTQLSGTLPPAAGKVVMVCSPDPELGQSIGSALINTGHIVQVVETLEHAGTLIALTPVDAIVADCVFPAPAITRLAKRVPRAPLVALLSLEDTSAVPDSACVLLEKPVDDNRLVGVLGWLLARPPAKRALVVEDDPAYLAVLQAELSAIEDLAPLFVAGPTAFRLAKRFPFEFLIAELDLGAQHGSGLDLAERVPPSSPPVRMVFNGSRYPDNEELNRMQKLGASHLTKSEGKLVPLLRELIRRSKAGVL